LKKFAQKSSSSIVKKIRFLPQIVGRLQLSRQQRNKIQVNKDKCARLEVAQAVAVFIFAATSFSLLGCVSTVEQNYEPKKIVPVSDFGQWRGQGTAMKIKSSDTGKKNENWTIGLEIVSRTPGYGRIEVTGAMGIYGGTIAWTETETRILLPSQKKFVIAPNSPRAFQSILPMEVSPAEIEAILFDRDFDRERLKRRGISCKTSTDEGRGKPTKEFCASETGFSIDRTRGYEVTSFEIKSEDGSRLKMNLKPVRSKVEERAELWSLEPPRGFKVIR
jgi:hypothetical protein